MVVVGAKVGVAALAVVTVGAEGGGSDAVVVVGARVVAELVAF